MPVACSALRTEHARCPAAPPTPIHIALARPRPASPTQTHRLYYTFLAPSVVTHVHPAVGTLGGGTEVTVTGRHFNHGGDKHAALWCHFGAMEPVPATVLTETQLTCVSPSGRAHPHLHSGPARVRPTHWWNHVPTHDVHTSDAHAHVYGYGGGARDSPYRSQEWHHHHGYMVDGLGGHARGARPGQVAVEVSREGQDKTRSGRIFTFTAEPLLQAM